MGTSNAQLVMFKPEPLRADAAHPVLVVPVVATLVQGLMPELLDRSSASNKALDEIQHYLFAQPKLKSRKLEKMVLPEAYDTLYALKAMIKNHGLQATLQILAEDKRRFAVFLREVMED